MYLNFNILKNSGIEFEDLKYLIGAKQRETEVLETIPEHILKRLERLSLIKYIKIPNKKANPLHYLRLDSAGKKLLDNLDTPEVTEQHLKMRDYLIAMYLSHEDKERVVGNKKLIGIYISVLQNHLGLDIYRFYYLCEFFLSEHIYSKKLENIFMDRNKIRYGEFKNHIEDSHLYQFYEQRKQEVEWYWRQKIK